MIKKEEKQVSKKYFPALDGLRFLAFLSVFVHHVTFYLRQDIIKNPIWNFFRNNGWVGVDVFFVLTGFLITFSLLEERANFGSFSLKKFNFKRILRIWPLYFLALFVGFFVMPLLLQNSSNFDLKNLPWYLFFIGNFKIVISGWGNSRAISELWAISVDQQFYLFWPLILLLVKDFRKSIIVSALIAIFSILVRAYLVFMHTQHPEIYVNTFARLDTFMYGATLAFVLFYRESILKKLGKFSGGFFQAGCILFLILFLAVSTINDGLAIRNGIFGYVVTGTIFTYLVFCLISSESFLAKLCNIKFIRELGKISFGLYVWHVLALELVFYFFKNDWITVFAALPLAILLGFLSYRFFEKPFLQIKAKF